MKFKSILFAAVGLLGLAVGCTEKEGTPSVKVETKEVTVPADGSAVTVNFTSAASWEIQDISEDWLVVSPGEGRGSSSVQSLTVSASANDGFERSATFVIWSASYAKKTVTVYQEGGKVATVALVLEEKNTETVYPLTGKIGNIATSEKYYGFTLNDGTGSIACPFPSNWSDYSANLHTGDEVSLSGSYSYYESKSEDQIKNAVIKKHTPVDAKDIEAITVADFLTKKDLFSRYRLTGTVSSVSTGTYMSFTLTDDSQGSVLVYTINNKEDWMDTIKNGGTVTLIGAYSLYNGTVEVIDANIESFDAAPVQKVSYEGLVVAVTKKAFLVQTSDSYQYAFNSAEAPTVKVGDQVKVEGEVSNYNGLDEVVNYTVTTVSSGNVVTYPNPQELDAVAFDSYSTVFGYVKFRGKLSIDSSKGYYNVTVPNAGRVGSIVDPTNVDETLAGKYVDVTGYFIVITGTKYFNVVAINVAESDDQSDPAADPEASNSLEPLDGEVLYALTSEEIVAAYTDANYPSAKYDNFTFTSRSGYNWTGFVYVPKAGGNTYIQIKAKETSSLTSSEYPTEVTRVVLSINKITGARDFYAIPEGTDLNASSNYTSKYWENKYGHTSCVASTTQNVAMAISEGVTQFTLIAAGGSAYIDAIYVFCKEAE